MKTLIKMFITRFHAWFVKLLREYMQTKYGPKSDVCAVSWRNNQVYIQTTHTSLGLSPDRLHMARHMVGENILGMYGLPGESEKLPVIKLVVWPSVLRHAGFRNTYKFIKGWRGKSEARGIIIVRYIL